MTNPHPIIAITLGDPGGIGPEVTVKALARLSRTPLMRRASVILVGPRPIYQAWIKRTGLKLILNALSSFERRDFSQGKVYLYDSGGCPSAHALGLQGGSKTGGLAASSPGLARGPQPQQAFRSPRRGYSPGVQAPRRPLGAAYKGGGRPPTLAAPGEWPSGARSLDRSGIRSHFGSHGPLPKKEYPPSFAVGKVSRNNAVLALSSLRLAALWASSGRIDGLVTAPVNKEAIRLIHPHFAGHTGYLATAARSKQVAMMFEGGNLRVTLASIHIPLKDVARMLKKADVVEKIKLTHEFLGKYHGLLRPRIAVCALNPHGGEFGREEGKIIFPAIRTARRKGIRAMGPFPGDAIFHEALRGKYDAVVAMYHDQGLGPLKTVAFHEAVNITLGLPYVRTSPDHGTAFDIAHRNRADESSMLSAIRRALELVS